MRTFIIKEGATIDTTFGTLLQVKNFDERTITFYEFDYNMDTNEYDILVDDNRILFYNEVKNLLHMSCGTNYKLAFEN